MSQANQTPPEIHEGRTDRTELFRLVNWLRRRAIGGVPGGLIGAVLSFDSISVSGTNRLDQFNFTGFADGTVCWVASVGDYFWLDTAGGQTADGITVVSCALPAAAQAIRLGIENREWAARTTWRVDPAAGSDEGDGSILSPIRTFAELGRRLADARITTSSIAVTLASSAPSTDPLVIKGVSTAGILTITVTGTPTVVASGRVMSAVTNPASSSANAYYSLTDATSFTSWLQTYLLHRTSGTQAWFWPYKDLGANVLQVSPPLTASSSTLSTLSAGDVYEVLELPTFASVVLAGNAAFVTAKVSQCRLIGTSALGAVAATSDSGIIQLDRCLIASPSLPFVNGSTVQEPVWFMNCCLPASTGGISISGFWSNFGGLYCGNGTTTVITATGAHSVGGNASNLITLGGARLDIVHDSTADRMAVMAYDWTGSQPVISVTHESTLQLDAIGGARNTSPLVGVDTFSRALSSNGFAGWNSAITTNSTTTYSVDSAQYTPAQLGAATNHVATRGTGIVSLGGSWTNDLSGIGINPAVIGLHETSGPTQLLYAGIADGTYFMRSGTTVVGDTPAGDHKIMITSADTTPNYASSKFVAGSGTTLTVLNPGANEQIQISATGSGGTVTAVTATLPLTSSGGTTPNIALNYDGVSLDLSGGATLRRAALTGDVTAPAGSNTLTLATVNASPGTYTYATVTVNGKGLATAVSSGAAPALAATTLTTTSPLRIDGGASADLSTNRTLSILDFVGSGVGHARGAVPDPGAVAGSTKFLCENGTWATPSGSGGTVTSVTATLPLTSSGGTTPDIALNYDGVSLDLTGGTTLERAAITGAVEIAAGSNLSSFLTMSAASVIANATGAPSPGGIFAATTVGDVLWKSGAGLAWSAIPVSSVTGAVPNTRTVTGTAPIAIAGGHAAVDLSANRTWSLDTNGVTDTFLRQGGATSVIGRSANSTGNVADISAASDGQILRRAAGVLGFGSIPVASVTGAVPDTRTLAATSPILIDGGAGPLDLSANRTFSHANSALAAGVHGGSGIASFETDAKGHVIDVTTASYATSRQVNLTWTFGASNATGFGAAGYILTSSLDSIVVGAAEVPLAQARATLIFEVWIYDNSLSGGTGSWTLSIMQNGFAVATLGPFSSGTTGYQATGIVSIGGSTGDTYGLYYDSSSVTAFGTTISFTANAVFDT